MFIIVWIILRRDSNDPKVSNQDLLMSGSIKAVMSSIQCSFDTLRRKLPSMIPYYRSFGVSYGMVGL